MQPPSAASRETDQQAPAFARLQWNGWGCAAIACASFAIFFLVQTALLVVIFFSVHPEYMRALQAGVVPPGFYNEWRKASLLATLLTPSHLALLSLAGDGALVLITLFLAYIGLGARARAFGLAVKPRAVQLLLGFAAGVGLTLVADLLAWTQTRVLGPHPQLLEKIFATRHGFESFGLDFLSVALMAPFAEELFFRGFLFAGLVQRMPLLWAAVISGALFSLAHGDLWNFVPLGAVGVGLAFLYHRTKTLWPNVLAHGTFNAISLIVTYLWPQLIK